MDAVKIYCYTWQNSHTHDFIEVERIWTTFPVPQYLGYYWTEGGFVPGHDVKLNKWTELKESKLFDKTYLGNTNQTAITGTCLTSLLKNDSNMS